MEEMEYKTKRIPDFGETSRLIISDSLIEECHKLQEINEASDYIEKWVGWKTPKIPKTRLCQRSLPLYSRRS